MTSSDFDLLDAWREGDVAAGEMLFERHFEAVHRFFFNKTGEATDDLVQQTFLACVEARDCFRKQSSFRTYLLGIARNRLYKFVRSVARNREDGPPSSLVEEVSLASVLAHNQEQRLLLRALRRLPLDLQIALEFAYWEEMTDRELSELLELPIGTVKSRLRKGRQLLEQLMNELAQSQSALRSTLDDFEGWARSIRELGRDRRR